MICSRAEWALGGVLVSTSAGAHLLRKAVPSALGVLALMGWMISKPLLTEVHFTWVQVSALALVSGFLLVGLVTWSARILDCVEQKQRKAEEALQVSKEMVDGLLGRFEDSPVEVRLRLWVTGGIVLAMVLTSFMGFLSWRGSRMAEEDADWVAHTYEVKAMITTAMGHAVDIETGVRGYDATGQDLFLEPYWAGQGALVQDLDRLRRQTADNPMQQQWLDLLESEINSRIESARESVNERRRAGTIPSRASFLEGNRQMDKVRAAVAEMQGEETRLLDQRVARTREACHKTRIIALGGALTGVAFLLLAGLSIRREIKRSTSLRGHLKALNAALEQRVEQRTTALRLSQERFSAVIQSAMDAIITVDERRRIVLFNAAAEKTFRCRASEVLGQTIDRFIPDHFRAAHAEHIRNFSKTGTTNRSVTDLGTILALRADGDEFPMEASISQVEAASEKIFTVILRDVTERKQAENALREQAHILDSAQVFVRDMQSRVVFWPGGAEKLYGFTPQEALGVVSYDLFHTQFSEPLEKIEKKLFESGIWEGELIHRKRDDSTIVVSSAWVLHRNSQGQATRILETNIDITARKQAEREIHRLNDELEQRVLQRTSQLQAANQELEAFTYSVSHDLRAPLRHISGFSKILSEEYGPSLAPEAQHHLQRIQEGVLRMGMLVDDLLNLARVGRRDLSLRVAGLTPMVDELITELEREYEGREIQWKIGELPFVECDPGLMKQVFQNLLSNAIKFTRPRPQAVIEVGHKKDENGFPVVFVRDNGVGFSMKYAEKLFGVFQRLHRIEDFEGTGVGLATVQRIIQKHGGRVWAEAELDRGAIFYFSLGAAETPELKVKASAVGGES